LTTALVNRTPYSRLDSVSCLHVRGSIHSRQVAGLSCLGRGEAFASRGISVLRPVGRVLHFDHCSRESNPLQSVR
jgi:hypothetical protein